MRQVPTLVSYCMRWCSQHCCWVHLWYVYLNTVKCSLCCDDFAVDDNFFLYAINTYDNSIVTVSDSHRSVFYRPDALPAAQPTASKHWRHNNSIVNTQYQLKGMNFVVGYCYVWRRRDKHRTTKLNKFQKFSWWWISTYKKCKKQVKDEHAVEMCRYSIWRDEFIVFF